MIAKKEVFDIINRLETKHMKYRDEASAEDSRAYYSNQAVVIALEELKIQLKQK